MNSVDPAIVSHAATFAGLLACGVLVVSVAVKAWQVYGLLWVNRKMHQDIALLFIDQFGMTDSISSTGSCDIREPVNLSSICEEDRQKIWHAFLDLESEIEELLVRPASRERNILDDTSLGSNNLTAFRSIMLRSIYCLPTPFRSQSNMYFRGVEYQSSTKRLLLTMIRTEPQLRRMLQLR